MADPQIHGTIEDLVAEEHQLWQRESDGTASDDDRRRLEAVKVSLDQCWDLLRQRRARSDAGLDPEQAELRRPSVVEKRASSAQAGLPMTWRSRCQSSSPVTSMTHQASLPWQR